MFLLSFVCCYAQQDSASSVYDVVYLTKGGVLQGQILSFDEEGGGLVFKDVAGRIYSLSREEYKYFKKDLVYKQKAEKAFVLRTRQDSGWAISGGLAWSYHHIVHDFAPSDYYLNGIESTAFLPLSLKVSALKYLQQNQKVGATVEWGIWSEASPSFQVGMRYEYHYDASRRNIGWYFPVELTFSHLNFQSDYGINDTLFDGQGGYTYPSYASLEIARNDLNFSVGQGMAFYQKNQSVGLVEAYIRPHYQLSQRIAGQASGVTELPDSEYRVLEWGLRVLFEF